MRRETLVRTWRMILVLSAVGTLTTPSLAIAVPQITGYAASNPRGVPISNAPPGAPLLVKGVRLSSGGSVWFNGLPVPDSTNWSPTEIAVVVPAAPFYPYRGPIVVRVGDQMAFGPEFTITAPSRIVGLPATIPGTADGRIHVANATDGDTLRYPVALLRGTVDGSGTDLLQVTNTSSTRLDRVSTAEVYQGRFKALVELVPGSNKIDLQTGDGSAATLTLIYQPMTTALVARMIYLTDSTGNTLYPTQKSNDPQDYVDKLGTAAELMQTFTAERLNDKGFGRKTFKLELDADGRVIVHTLRAPKPAAHYQSLTATQVYDEIYDWIDQQLPMNTGKDLVITAFTRWDPAKNKVLGGDALGGGGMATFVNLDMFTWPSSLQDVPYAFTDNTPIDTSYIRDDSGNHGRGTLWNVAATTIGAPLHELGHTFGLDHSTDPLSIMLRGFDFYNCAFMAAEPPIDPSGPSRLVTDNEVPYFDVQRAGHLAASPWFQPDSAPAGPPFLVDIGNPTSEASYDLTGWGPVQNDGIFATVDGDRTKRYMPLDGTCSLTFNGVSPGMSYYLTTDVEDGACDDSFEILVGGVVLYSFTADPNPTTVVRRHTVTIPANLAKSNELTVAFHNTARDNCGLAAVYDVGLVASR